MKVNSLMVAVAFLITFATPLFGADDVNTEQQFERLKRLVPDLLKEVNLNRTDPRLQVRPVMETGKMSGPMEANITIVLVRLDGTDQRPIFTIHLKYYKGWSTSPHQLLYNWDKDKATFLTGFALEVMLAIDKAAENLR